MPIETPFFVHDDHDDRIHFHGAGSPYSYNGTDVMRHMTSTRQDNRYGLNYNPSYQSIFGSLWSDQHNYQTKYIPDLRRVDENHVRLASVVYGEASDLRDFNEMNSIAITDVRMMRAHNTVDVDAFHGAHKNYSYAWRDTKALSLLYFFNTTRHELAQRISNSRYQLRPSIMYTSTQIAMLMALDAAYNVLSDNPKNDTTNDSYFWQGGDFAKQLHGISGPVVPLGYHVSSSDHANTFNPYLDKHSRYKGQSYPERVATGPNDKSSENTPDQNNPGKFKTKTGKVVNYPYVWETTAAFGGTLFFRYSDAYMRATGTKPWAIP